jgi:hypothetical protein
VNETVPVGVIDEPVTVTLSVADKPLMEGVVDTVTVQAATLNDPVPVEDE